jgi:hypothetical protein
MDDIVWAILLYSFGAVLINLGSNIVKYGHTLSTVASKAPPVEATGCAARICGIDRAANFRILGWVLFAVGGGFNFYSFSYGPQSVLASLAAIQFVSNIFFGALINGEKVSIRTVLGTMIIVSGTSTIVALSLIFEKSAGGETTVEILISLWIKTPMIIWVVANTIAFLVLEVVRRRLGLRERAEADLALQGGPDAEEYERKAATTKIVRGVVFGSTSAILGS